MYCIVKMRDALIMFLFSCEEFQNLKDKYNGEVLRIRDMRGQQLVSKYMKYSLENLKELRLQDVHVP